MAQKTIVHRGYHGTIEVNREDFSLHGKVLFLDEEICYAGESFAELETAFRDAVETHIEQCLAGGKEIPFREA